MEILLCLSVMMLGASATVFNETTSSTEIRELQRESPSNDTIVTPDASLENSVLVNAEETKEEVATAEQPVNITFPENHKNSTEFLLLGEEIQSPYHDLMNNYQHQYKAYIEQKQLFNRNPIKFENDLKKTLIGNGLDVAPKDVQSTFQAQEKREKKLQKKPFPYVFEQNKIEDLYKNEALSGTEGGPKNEFRVSGHQVIPQFIFSRGYPHEEKMYKTESVTDIREGVKKGKDSPWKKVFHVLTALVPLGLVLASLAPNVISVNSTAGTKITRQRSEDSFPIEFKQVDVIQLMNKFGVKSLAEAQCEDRLICELGRRGNSSAAAQIEKRFWFLANETPWDFAEKVGVNDLFKAIKTGTCETYKCYFGAKLTHNKNQIGKKLIRKRKIQEK